MLLVRTSHVVVILLHGCVVHSQAEELQAASTIAIKQRRLEVFEFVENLVGQLFSVAYDAPPFENADVDATILGQPTHLAHLACRPCAQPRPIIGQPLKAGLTETGLAAFHRLVEPRWAGCVCHGKKKGGGGKAKKGGKKDGMSGFERAKSFQLKPTENKTLREFAEFASSSYRTHTGKSLIDTFKDFFTKQTADVPKALWALPACIMVVQADENATDGAVVAYANPAAAEAYGQLGADGYKALLGKSTVLPPSMADKKYDGSYSKKLQLLAAVGSETSEPAATFTLCEAQRWVLDKPVLVGNALEVQQVGVAYAWNKWELADGTRCEPGGVRKQPIQPPEVVQASIDEQAAIVRKLKEVDGLTNADEEVKDAVAELLRRKAFLEEVLREG